MQLYGRKLEFGMRGPDVHLWQARLQLLGVNLPTEEVTQDYFGEATKDAVTVLQKKEFPEDEPTGRIDLKTARRILELGAKLVSAQGEQTYKLTDIDTRLIAQNRQLDGIGGLIGQQHQSLESIDRQMGGLGELLAGDAPLALNARGKAVAALHSSLVKAGYRIPQHEQSAQVFGVGTESAVRQLQAKYDLRRTGAVDEQTAAALSRAVALAETGQQHVEGRLFLDNGRPASDVVVRLYNRGFGSAAQLLGEVKTDADGYYAFAYSTNGKAANLEVRVAGGQNVEVSLSRTKFGADKHEVLNLVAPASLKPLAPEYERLGEALGKELADLDQLAAAEENDERHDLTCLSRATGWDARLIALLALAFEHRDETGLAPPILYALFRAGLPTDPQLLSRLSGKAVKQALRKAVSAGIVACNEDEIGAAISTFEKFAGNTRLTTKSPGALSTFGELLEQRAGLDVAEEARLTDQEKAIFADLYFSHRGTPAELWQKALEQNIAPPKIEGLRLQGKLAYLTLNNARLTASLQQEIEARSSEQRVAALDNLGELVDMDLYHANAWEAWLRALDEDPQVLIPPAYAAGGPEARLKIYAADLARQVRQSFPTQVVRRMVEKGEISLGERHEAVVGDVSAFLKQADAGGFKLGQTPVDRFVRDNETNFEPKPAAETTAMVKQLYRQYQITPSDEAMQVVADLGFTSAHDVAAFSHADFLRYYGYRFDSDDPKRSRQIADLVYRKAQQVSAVTFNVLTMARLMDTSPRVYAMFPPPSSPVEGPRIDARAKLIRHYPSLEGLLGSIDFCECEHCRSVLSPAAYLVDLLHFLDPSDEAWTKKLEDWHTKHGEAPYPFKNRDEWNAFRGDFPHGAVPNTELKPYDVLAQRRPDLPCLSLTCENTNTAMPYIDLVNEVFEYYVANWSESEDGLEGFEGYDTGDATTEELLAEPQNVVRDAYHTLQAAKYPLTLPFDLWLETVRQFLDHFETPLWQVYEVFRTTDQLFGEEHVYDQAAIFGEYLGLSPSEYELFTVFDPDNWYQLYGYDSEDKAEDEWTENGQRMDLNSAKALSRRLGVTYQELVDIVQTGFVNPRLNTLVAPPDVDDRVLVLADPDSGCNFDQTILRYAGGGDADRVAFLKINFFVRLWKRLGWTTEETDRALQVFIPGGVERLTSSTLGERLRTALIYMAHLKALDEQLDVGKDGRLKLLTLWSDLPTTGKNPLYARLFLTPGMLREDKAADVFDHPLGKYLCYLDEISDEYRPFYWDPSQEEDVARGNVSLRNHLLAVQGALGLTADEVAGILSDADLDLDTAALSLANVSLLYRYGLLAGALDLSVTELIALKALSGVDPFAPLTGRELEMIEDDHPFTETIRFVEIVEVIRESGFSIEELDYLLRHRFDPLGTYRPDPAALLALVKALAANIQRIQAEHAILDPAELTDDLLQQKLALVLPPDVVATFMSMWTATVEYKASQPVAEEFALDPASFAAEPAIHVAHDKGEQRLIYRGVLVEAEKSRLEAAHPSAVLESLLDDIYTQVQEHVRPFFERNFVDLEFPFLEAADFDAFFTPPPPILDDADEEEKRRRRQEHDARVRANRTELVQAFLPYLQYKLTRQMATELLASSLDGDPALVEALITDPTLLSLPGSSDQPLLDAFAGAATCAVTATFFDEEGLPLNTRMLADVDAADMPGGTRRAGFEGYLEVATTGPYRFYASVMLGAAEAEMRFDHLPDPLLAGSVTGDDRGPGEIDEATELRAGIPYRFTFDASELAGDSVQLKLLVQGETLPKGSLDRLALFPQAAVDRVRQAQVLLRKALRILQGLGLGEREVRYLLTHASDFDDLDLSWLPASPEDPTALAPAALMAHFLRLAAYARLKHDLAGGTDDLISLFENATRAEPDATDLCQRLADLTRRPLATVQAVAQHFRFIEADDGEYVLVDGGAHFAREQGVDRLWQALQIVEKLGLPVDTVVDATAIVRCPVPGDDDRRFAIAQNLRNTVKARYEPAAWQRVARSIFDRLRQRQRDALVAYIMHVDGFDRMEQLFESFLIDPGMEPVVQTSRLRLAISSVQLFIQRCLLNMEPWVHPTAINSQHWQWMKRCRVWEANRKFFLYPENWLEPEFRDDKTHLFRELESALLQGDVSSDLAEDAFFNYLKKLEKLARLEMVTMYCQEKENSPGESILHVIGRTYNTSHEYFYRRYDTASRSWTPWEPVTAQIEGDHLVAVVWRQRLHLFWLTFLEKAESSVARTDQTYEGMAGASISDTLPTRIVEVQLNSCEYFQGKWTTRESSGHNNSIMAEVDSEFATSEVFIHVSRNKVDEEERGVKINIGRGIVRAFGIVSKNSNPEDTAGFFPLVPIYDVPGIHGTKFESSKGASGLKVWVEVIGDYRKILRQGDNYSLLFGNPFDRRTPGEYMAKERELLQKEFFYEDKDAENTFFVVPRLAEPSFSGSDSYAAGIYLFDEARDELEWWERVYVEAGPPPTPTPSVEDERVSPTDPYALYRFRLAQDWATDPAVVVQFNGRLIGQDGGVDVAEDETMGSGWATARGLIVVGSGGVNSATLGALEARHSAREAEHLSGHFPPR